MPKTTDDNKPLVDPNYVSRVFTTLEKMTVELDPDPLEFGPSRLSKKVQQCRAFLNIVEQEALAASRELHRLKEKHRAASRLYKMDEDKLLTSDPEVRAGRSVEDRRAVARIKLPKQVAELTRMEQGIEDLEAVLGWLKYKQSGLRNTQSQLKEQRNLCNEEIGLGRTWQNKELPSTPLRPGQGRGTIHGYLDEADNVLRELMGEDPDLPEISEEESEASEEDEDTDEGSEEDTDEEETKLELVPGMVSEDETSTSDELLPSEEETDPSEEVENTDDAINAFLESPDETDTKPGDSDKAETEEIDIEDLLDGLG